MWLALMFACAGKDKSWEQPAEAVCLYEGEPLCDRSGRAVSRVAYGGPRYPEDESTWGANDFRYRANREVLVEQLKAFPLGFVKVNAEPMPPLPESDIYGTWTACDVGPADIWVSDNALEAYLSRASSYPFESLLVRVDPEAQEVWTEPDGSVKEEWFVASVMAKMPAGYAPDLNDWNFNTWRYPVDGETTSATSDLSGNEACYCAVCHRLDNRQAETDMTFGVPEALVAR